MKSSNIIKAVSVCMNIKRPVMIWGPPGVGKSDVIRQIAEMTGKIVFDIRLALLDPTDLRGIPYYDPNLNTAEWAKPGMLPTPEDGPCILFLDEINGGLPGTQAASYQLVLDRRIGNYFLPDDCDIIAAGNRESDRGVVYKMPTPLLNRFTHIDFDHNTDDWLRWASKNRVRSDVMGFIKQFEGSLNCFDPTLKNNRGFCTSRSWTAFSQILDECYDNDVPDEITHDLGAGTIGSGKAIEFFNYRKNYLYLPDPMDILDGSVKSLPTKAKNEISVHYGLIISLVSKLDSLTDDININTYMNNFMMFLDNNLQEEFVIFGLIDCTKGDRKISLHKASYYSNIAKKYGKYI